MYGVQYREFAYNKQKVSAREIKRLEVAKQHQTLK